MADVCATGAQPTRVLALLPKQRVGFTTPRGLLPGHTSPIGAAPSGASPPGELPAGDFWLSDVTHDEAAQALRQSGPQAILLVRKLQDQSRFV